MNLLGAKLYDPTSAATKATSALLAMTAFDTANLRIAFTVPGHGIVRVHMRCAIEGATTFPQVLLGVLNGAAVVGRAAPVAVVSGTAVATTRLVLDAEFTVTGLTPGAVNWDAAYGVEITVASTNIKYGGPNDTTTDNAWGAFVFEVWDPQPIATTGQLFVDANGRVDVIKVAGTTQTARDIGASVLLSSGSGAGQLDFTSGVVKANLAQILGTAFTEGVGGRIAAAFKQFFNVGSPVMDVTGVNQTGDAYARLGAPAQTASISGDIENVYERIGPPVGGSVVGDIAAVQTAADAIYERIGPPVGDSIVGDIAAIADNVTAIKAVTDLIMFLPDGSLFAGHAIASADVVSATSSSVLFGSSLGYAVDGAFVDAVLYVWDGVGKGQCRIISGWDYSGHRAYILGSADGGYDFNTTPDATSKVLILIGGGASASSMSGLFHTLDGVSSNVSDFDERLPGSLVEGRMDSSVGEVQSGANINRDVLNKLAQERWS